MRRTRLQSWHLTLVYTVISGQTFKNSSLLSNHIQTYECAYPERDAETNTINTWAHLWSLSSHIQHCFSSENDMLPFLGHVSVRLHFWSQTSFWIILIWDTHLLCIELCPLEMICESPEPQDLKRWPFLETGSSKKQLSWNEFTTAGPRKHDWYLYKSGKFEHRDGHTSR